MNLPYLLVTHELSDEAAAQLSVLLDDLAVAFDGQYFAQITRYYDERGESERSCHHNQLELFIDDNVAFQVPCRSRERPRPPRPFVDDRRGSSTLLRHDHRVRRDHRGAYLRPRPALRR